MQPLDAVRHTGFIGEAKPQTPHTVWTRYATAALLVLLALGVSYILQTLIGYRAPLIFFVAASLIAGWYGGLGPGLVALIVGLLIGDYFFIPPLYRFGDYSRADLVLLSAYASVTAIGLAAITNLHYARQREEQTKRWNKELEHRIQQRTAELEAFCYSVSHDLRGPLRSIGCFTQLLKEGYEPCLDEEGKNMLNRVIQSTDRTNQLLADLQTLFRLSLNKMQWQLVDLSALVRSIAENLRKNDPARQVDFTIAPGVTAWGDEALLRLALEHLLDNAWKFTGKRARSLITFGYEQRGGQTIYFVDDNGIGFDMAYANNLFGVFQRLHSETDIPGTGIGLAMVKRVIERHGGEIWATAGRDKGAIFSFTLPTVQPTIM